MLKYNIFHLKMEQNKRIWYFLSECNVNGDILRRWYLSSELEVDWEATRGKTYQTESPSA